MARITEQELDNIIRVSCELEAMTITATDVPRHSMHAASIGEVAVGLVAEVRRLRGLLLVAADEVPAALDRSINGHTVLAEADAIRAEARARKDVVVFDHAFTTCTDQRHAIDHCGHKNLVGEECAKLSPQHSDGAAPRRAEAR